MWGTDMTATLLGTGRQVAVLVAVDRCPAGCVGIHAATRGTRFEALQPIRQGVRECFGAIGKDLAAGLIVRHDKGSQYISHDFQNEVAWLGATASLSFVRALEGKGGAERCISTLKENLLWIGSFETIQPKVQGRRQGALADPAPGAAIAEPVQMRRHGQNPSRRASFKSVSITLGRYTLQINLNGKAFGKRQTSGNVFSIAR